MAKINQYDTGTPALNDRLLGTDVSDTTNDTGGETVSFTPQGLLTLFEPVIEFANTKLADDTGGNGANAIAVTDTGSKFTATNVNTVLVELQANIDAHAATLASTANGDGASLIGVEDTGSKFTATTVEGAVVELDTKRLALVATLASTANGDGASTIGVEDTGAKFATDNVEAALTEIMGDLDAVEADYLTSSDVGVSVQAFDGDTLKADTTDVLTAAFEGSIDDDGYMDTGTYTPSIAAGSNYKMVTVGGNLLIDPPSPSGNDIAVSVDLLIVNDTGGGGTISTTNFSDVDGDSFTATADDIFIGFITTYDVGGTEYSSITVKQLVAN